MGSAVLPFRTKALALFLALLAVPVLADENLLLNGSFDRNVAGWSADDVAVVWNPVDSHGAAASGSLEATPELDHARIYPTMLDQVDRGCLSGSPATGYVLEADFSIPNYSSTEVFPVPVLFLCWVAPISGPCSGVSVGCSPQGLIFLGAAWHKQRVRIRKRTFDNSNLDVTIYFAMPPSASGSVLLDNLHLFELPEGSFWDDFETGSTAQWSGTSF